jgi:hypothetical protein
MYPSITFPLCDLMHSSQLDDVDHHHPSESFTILDNSRHFLITGIEDVVLLISHEALLVGMQRYALRVLEELVI